jgi:hypothetical protein
MTRVKISGVFIKSLQPEKFTVERYNLTKSGRVASGKMMMDLIAKKRRLDLEYEVISGADFEKILSLIDGTKMFFTVEWEDYTGWNSAVCYAGAIPNTHYRGNSGYYYKGVKFALIEQ